MCAASTTHVVSNAKFAAMEQALLDARIIISTRPAVQIAIQKRGAIVMEKRKGRQVAKNADRTYSAITKMVR